MDRIVRPVLEWAFRRGARSAVDTALGAAVEAVPRTSQRAYTQVFNVQASITVYVRASQCRITIRRAALPKVILEASISRAFGPELAAEQDEAGVYIVARPKPVVGRLSRADFTITVPADSHLVFHLTPGDVILEDLEGMLELPPLQPASPASSPTP